MLSNRPYLVRAFHQWIVDSQCTPILVLDAKNPSCKIPKDYIEGGEIVFNVSTNAVRDLRIANDFVEFKASFSGVIHIISAPVQAIMAIYAEENGEGLFLEAEEDEGSDSKHSNSPMMMQMMHTEGSGAIADNFSPERTPSQSEVSAGKNKPFLTLVE